AHRRRRLKNDACPRPDRSGQGGERLRLQDDDAVRERQRPPCPRAGAQIAVQVRPGQSNDQRALRTHLPVPRNTRIASPRVQRDEHIAWLTRVFLHDLDAVTQSTEHAAPADRGHAVALARTRRCGTGEHDFHTKNYTRALPLASPLRADGRPTCTRKDEPCAAPRLCSSACCCRPWPPHKKNALSKSTICSVSSACPTRRSVRTER